MKKIIYITILTVTILFGSCDDFLDTTNLTEHDLESYYSNPEQIENALGGVYNSFFIKYRINNEPDLVANVLSDEMFAGGGSDDIYVKNIEFWEDPNEDTYLGIWETYYQGIFRANVLLERFDQADYGDDVDARNQALGEAHFMRAFFYFRLAQVFGSLPIITSSAEDPNQPRGTLDETYALIASDLKFAIDIMPKTPFTSISADRLGHANIWVAQAFMARVYLFYTGYSSNTLGISKDTLPLLEGGSISKSEVQTWLREMIANSGHALLSDPRNMWAYSNASNYGYEYGANEGLIWAGEGNDNLEIVFAVKYATFSNWSPEGRSYVNQLGLFQGVRDNSMTPFGQGWGWCTVNPELWSAYEVLDVRQKGYILDVKATDEGSNGYKGAKGDHETGLWNKKYSNIQYDAGSGVLGMFYNLYGGQKNFMLWHTADQVLMRYADVLLMAAELDIDAQSNLDAVRLRANASPVSATIENIRNERRLELCFEGLRYYDLLRWGNVEPVLTGVNVTVSNYGVEEQFQGVYRSETNGLLPIPESQIRLSNGVLTQNPGW